MPTASYLSSRHHCLQLLSRYLNTLKRNTQIHTTTLIILFSRLKSPSFLSLSSYIRYFIPLILFIALLQTISSMSMTFVLRIPKLNTGTSHLYVSGSYIAQDNLTSTLPSKLLRFQYTSKWYYIKKIVLPFVCDQSSSGIWG